MINCTSLPYNEIYDFFHITKNDFPNFSNQEWSAAYAKKLSQNAKFICCRNTDGHLVGMVAFYMNRPPLCYISHVSVLPAYKRLGLFSAMYSYVEAEAMGRGCSNIKLEVKDTNVPAIRAYHRTGFVTDGRSKDNNMYMTKLLNFVLKCQ